MIPERKHQSPRQYKNPVYPHSFPDPFVIKFEGAYYAYCTGHWSDGRVFGVLRSLDLIDWEPLGGAMHPVDDPAPFYWAPEVTYDNGLFYLYYSMGNEALMHIRVATSDRPDGGFIDSGRKLTTEDFAIDGHVFVDDDGQEYFFYAVDFLQHTHIGTGIVVDRMLDRYTLAGEPRPVVRAKYDWQVYDPARKEKGGVRWHTVEGPFVLKRDGTYFIMYSGGNWQNPSYGVSFATTDDLNTTAEWEQFSNGTDVPPILRTYPEKLIGPGHNSVIRGPNNREIYCVYHLWHEGERVLGVNRMDFVGRRLVIEGSPYLLKSFPYLPSAAGHTEPLTSDFGSFLCESTFVLPDAAMVVAFGFRLEVGERESTVMFEASGQLLSVNSAGLEVESTSNVRCPAPGAANLLRVEVHQSQIDISVNGRHVLSGRVLAGPVRSMTFFAEEGSARWTATELTEGFELTGERLSRLGLETAESSIQLPAGDFEFAANLRCISPLGQGANYGLTMKNGEGGAVAEVLVGLQEGRHVLLDASRSMTSELPSVFQPEDHHQFRIEKIGDRMRLFIDLAEVGSIRMPEGVLEVGILRSGVPVELEMVRVTVLK